MELPDKEINAQQLAEELRAAGIQTTGINRLSRKDGLTVPRKIFVKAPTLTAEQQAIVTQIVTDHTPVFPSTLQDQQDTRWEELFQLATWTHAELKEALTLARTRS